MTMHADELAIDEELVRELLREQFPVWSHLQLCRIASSGTVNALFRLGDEMVVRLPRVPTAEAGVAHEHAWLPRLAPALPIQIPDVLARGVPSSNYPLAWSVLSWIEGSNPLPQGVAGNSQLVDDIASFLIALRQVDGGEAPQAYRGGFLAEWDKDVRAALLELRGRADVAAAEVIWEQALSAGQWTSQPVWVHSDLMPGNLLLNNGRLVGVIDFEAAGVGDPACDLMVAWNLLDAEGRQVLRTKLSVDDDTWIRGRGWAISQALVALPYYWDTNPVMVSTAKYVLQQLSIGDL